MFPDAFDLLAPRSPFAGAQPLSDPNVSVTPEQAADALLRDGYHWGAGGQPVTLSYAFRATDATYDNGVDGFNRFNAAQIKAAELALASWSDVANVNFNRVGQGQVGDAAYSDSAQILFGNYTSGADGAAAFAYYPGGGAAPGDVWVNSTLDYNATPVVAQYGFSVLTHEIGHTLGLQHPGDYDAGDGAPPAYNTDAAFEQDTVQYSVMSYFTERGGADLGGYSPSAPQMFDIVAAQRLYGANMETRTGDTVYGVHATADRPWFSANASRPAVFCVWDAGGSDTLDFSGDYDDQYINLQAGGFSNTGGLIGNVSIAPGVVIENAIGGRGRDSLEGNDVANVLIGGGGQDWLTGWGGDDILVCDIGAEADGGEGYDIADFSAAARWLYFRINGDNSAYASSGLGGLISMVEKVIATRFDDIATMTEQGGAIDGGAGDDRFISNGVSPFTIQGGAGSDTFALTNASGAIAFALRDANLSSVENLEGSQHRDQLTGDNQANVITGMADNDTLVGAKGADTLNGGAGTDTVSYRGVRSVTIDMVNGNGGEAAGDVLIQIEKLILSTAADIYLAGDIALSVDGDRGDDVLTGANAVDRLEGGAGDDLLSGGGNNDQLLAGDGRDALAGGLGRDQLAGGGSNDSLDGGEGADTLSGGRGRDALTGGEGADVFVFSLINDSPAGGGIDRIEDFRHAQDRIDLSALAGDLGFIAEAAFSGGGAGEVRLSVTGQGRVVQVDVDGDGDADMAFLLAGAGQLTASDFIL